MQLTSSHQRSRISSQQIGEVISDLELIGHSNAKILFVVDPFEVIEFCFPIDPDRESNTNIEQLADDQAALFEVFYGRKLPTVLLPEYAEEITNHLDFVTRRSEEVYSKLELLESLTRKAELDSPESHKGNSELIKYFQSNFGVLLAVRMGIDSLGAERLRDVSMKLRMINEVEPQELMIDAIRTYRRSPLADYIYEYLMSDSKAADRLTVARRQGAALRDSRAIDFLLHLNKALERRSVNGDVGERRVFLYLSSAHRSRRVFLQEKVIQSLPRIAGHKHSLLRTKSQIFAYAFSKSRVEDESEERKRTIEHLGTYKVLVENLEEMESSPAKYTEAAKQDLLKAIKEREAELRGAHAAVENLGLFLRIKTYSKLFSDGDVRLERRKDASVGDIYAEVRALFKKASESQALEDLALQEMKTLQTQMALQSDFAARVPTALTIAVAAPDQTQEAAEEKSETAEEPCRIPSHVRIGSMLRGHLPTATAIQQGTNLKCR